jgi:hypothetical protein
MTSTDSPLKSGTAVHKFLQGLGYKISQAKIYKDIEQGRLGKQKDGTFSPDVLVAYARAFLEPVGGRGVDDRGAEAATNRLLADADLRSVQARRMQLKLDQETGHLIPREEHELALAARAQFFRNQVDVLCHLAAPRILTAVGGDEARLPDLILLLREMTAVWLDAFAADKTFVVEELLHG